MNGTFVGQLLEFPSDGVMERVLWIDPSGQGVYVINVNARGALPVFRESSEMDQLREEGAFRQARTDPWLLPASDDVIPPVHRARRDNAWALIKPLVFDQPAIFRNVPRADAIKRVIAVTGSNKPKIYRLLRRYWQRGLTPNALLPDYDRCGGRGKDKLLSDKKRGRLYREDRLGVNVSPEMRSLFKAVVTRQFAKNRKMDMRGAYDELIDKHFSDQVIDEATGRQVVVQRQEIPTLRQFRYWFEKDNDVFHIERIRRTPRVYDKDMRALLGSSTAETIGPGSRYQIDATIADVYLVSRYDRQKIVGRPVLYIVIDVFSRMIVGVYVGLEGPSWVGAMMALANAASEKVTYCHQFGIEITEAEWPCQAVPDVLLGDRGEIAGGAIKTLINNFLVQVENAAPYRADWKGIVEQRFRLLPAKFKAYVPGYIAEDYQARGGTDYRLDAELDIDQFTEIILYCVLYYNNTHLIAEYEKSPAMIADEVAAVPIDLWEWGIVNLSGRLRSYPADLVKLSLLPSDQATVTVHGIRYAGCYYSCPKAIEEHWFEQARQRGTWKVRISYEPRSMDEIYLHDEPGRARFTPCALTTRSRHDRGKTLWEIDQIRQEERDRNADHDRPILQGRINLSNAIEGVIDKAKAKHAGQPPDTRSDKERVGQIRQNRRDERRSNQDREAFHFSRPEGEAGKSEVVPFPIAKPEDDYSAPDITEYLSSRDEEGEEDDGAD